MGQRDIIRTALQKIALGQPSSVSTDAAAVLTAANIGFSDEGTHLMVADTVSLWTAAVGLSLANDHSLLRSILTVERDRLVEGLLADSAVQAERAAKSAEDADLFSKEAL